MLLNIDSFPANALAALDDSGAEVTYGRLCEFAGELSKLIPPRALIFILADNTVGSLCGYVGALSCRIVPVLLSARTDRQLFRTIYETYQPQYIWLPNSSELARGMKTVCSAYGFHLVETGFGRPEMHRDLALLLPTSGTTGSLKLVRHSYRNIEANAANVAAFFESTAAERPLVTLPMHYTMGLSVIASHLSVGATLLMSGRSLLDPLFWTFVREHRATSFTGVPFSFEVLKKIRFFRMNLPDLKLISQGGGKMSDDLFKACAEYATSTGKRFIATYGQTEGTARMAYLPAGLATEKTGSIGIAIPNGKITVIDPNGDEMLAPEAEGEMVYSGENVTLGYAYCRADLEKGDENNGVLRTGDIVRRDADGCHYIVGRMGRFLKLYGFRVGMDECEQLIRNRFPSTECVCIGDDRKMRVFVTDEDCRPEVADFLSAKTGIIPTAFAVEVIAEIPKNEAGKTAYAKLL